MNELKANAACTNISPLALPNFLRYHGNVLLSSILAALALFAIAPRLTQRNIRFGVSIFDTICFELASSSTIVFSDHKCTDIRILLLLLSRVCEYNLSIFDVFSISLPLQKKNLSRHLKR